MLITTDFLTMRINNSLVNNVNDLKKTLAINGFRFRDFVSLYFVRTAVSTFFVRFLRKKSYSYFFKARILTIQLSVRVVSPRTVLRTT